MTDPWLGPGLVDAIVAGVALEAAALAALLARRGAGRLIAPLLLYLASGACLLLALRASLAGAGDRWIALALGASGVAHLASLWRMRHLAAGGAP